MSKYNSQKSRILRKLNKDFFVTRNECLSQFPAITRLVALICDLRKIGYEFDTEDKNGDYKYIWTNPKPKEVFEVVEKNGIILAVKKEEEPKQTTLL